MRFKVNFLFFNVLNHYSLSLPSCFMLLQRQHNVKKFKVSSDKKYVLLIHDIKKVSDSKTFILLQVTPLIFLVISFKSTSVISCLTQFSFCTFLCEIFDIKMYSTTDPSSFTCRKIQNIQCLK